MNMTRTTPADFAGTLFLTDAGLETDMIFNRGQTLPEFAAHSLLSSKSGRQHLADYLSGFLELAAKHKLGFVLDSQTWRAQRFFSTSLNTSIDELADINKEAIEFIASLRNKFSQQTPVLLNGVIGPCGDGYAPSDSITELEAQDYHAEQLSWMAQTDINMVTALTITNVEEAIGITKAAEKFNLPVVVSFTVETDGKLPSGAALGDAIEQVDTSTGSYPAYYMVNCAHMDHFDSVLEGSWTPRLKGVRCNASRCSHEELDQSETLDAGDASEFGVLTAKLASKLPDLQVFGGCCGSDLRHLREIANSLQRL